MVESLYMKIMKPDDHVGEDKKSTNALATAFILVPLVLVIFASVFFGGNSSPSGPDNIGSGIIFDLLIVFAIVGLIVATAAAAARNAYVSVKTISGENAGKSRAVGNILLVSVAGIIEAWIILLEKVDFIAKMWQVLGAALFYVVIKSVWFLVDSYRGKHPMAERILPLITVGIGVCVIVVRVYYYMNPTLQ